MKRTKLYKLIIAALIVINVGMLIMFFAGKPHHGPPGPPKSGHLVKELGIDESKSALITKLETAHHAEKKPMMKKDRELHEKLFSKLGTDEDVSAIHAEIEENHAEIEKMTYEFFNEISGHCSSEQKKQLKKMIYRAFKQMKGPKK